MIVLHLIGFAALFGGTIVQLGKANVDRRSINKAMIHGTLTQLITGLALTALSVGDGLDPIKVAVKTAVLLVIGFLVFTNKKKSPVKLGILVSIALLTLANVVIAVVW